MTITDEQKARIAKWIEADADLAKIQQKLKEEFGISLTYLETRFLADDLKLQLKDPEPEPSDLPAEPEPLETAPPPGKVSATIDQITRPGAMISGRMTFSDGEKGDWYLDATGRIAMNPSTPGYRPSQEDLMAFQTELERLARAQGI